MRGCNDEDGFRWGLALCEGLLWKMDSSDKDWVVRAKSDLKRTRVVLCHGAMRTG